MMPTTSRSTPTADAVLPPGGRVAVQLLSAEMLEDYPSTTGIDFDWRVTPPRIAGLRAGHPAIKAGLLVGDLIVGVDGASMAGLNAAGVQNIIDSRPAGADVSITAVRGSQKRIFTMKTEPREL